MNLTRRRIRIAFVLVLVASLAVIAHGAVTAERTGGPSDVPQAPPTDNVTVATESARYGTIMAWHPNGSRLYYNDTYTKYFDVDPIEGTEYTVEYAATQTIHTQGETCSSPPCAINIIERANLSTGETEVIYKRYDATETASEWHDHVRVNDTHILIADMVEDQVLLVNTETDIIEWGWDAQGEFPVEGGGPFPRDWAHLNDVELLDDGRIMASLRNQDSVVFIDPQEGLQEDWTLGEDGEHDILYEQHNPDYIPEERGGPAVVVADSENGRIVEYQREGGTWNQTWEWYDSRMQWPRDADRLPNGNTLVTDTHGSRLLEIAPNGSIVWSVGLAHPYDVERLGTGEGSSGGHSAQSLGLESKSGGSSADTGGGGGGGGGIVDWVSDFLPNFSNLLETFLPHRIVNGILYISPIWMGKAQFWAASMILVVLVAWPVTELRWRFPDVALRSPVYREGAAESAATASAAEADSEATAGDDPAANGDGATGGDSTDTTRGNSGDATPADSTDAPDADSGDEPTDDGDSGDDETTAGDGGGNESDDGDGESAAGDDEQAET